MKHLTIGVLLSAFPTAACNSTTRSDPAADRQAIAAATIQFQAAENAGSVDQFRGFFADNPSHVELVAIRCDRGGV